MKRNLRACSAAFGLVLALGVGLSAGGCAVNRPTQSTKQLVKLKARYLEAARGDTQAANEKMIKRMRLEEDLYLAQVASGGVATRPTFDVLILSGGGDFGAFGAGVLKAWGDVKEPGFERPEFDMVTGVSTGALIAPFAFVGSDLSYGRILDLYTHPNPNWFRSNGLFFFLPGNESFMSSKGLRKDLEKTVDLETIRAVAEGSQDYRVLGINTTNLDVGAMHPFELSLEAERVVAAAHEHDALESKGRKKKEDDAASKRFYDILMASAAIPAAFPPVIIDGSLYVDGGTTSNILYGQNWRSPKAVFAQWKEKYPNDPLPKVRFWVIVNIQLGIEPQVVQPTWVSITKASLATIIRANTSTALRHLSTQVDLLREADGLDVEFRWMAIPSEWVPPNTRDFDAEVMRSLADLGLKMGGDVREWRRDFVERGGSGRRVELEGTVVETK